MPNIEPKFEEILAAKREYYGWTEAAIQFAAEEYARQLLLQQCSVSSSLHNTLLKWWDFMDGDCTAHRNEYTEQEQSELLQRFMSEQ